MNKLWLNYAVTVEGCRFDVVLVHLLETLAGYSVLDRIFGTFRDPVFVAAQFFFCRSAPLLRGQILTSFHQTQLVRLFVRVTARRSTYVTEFQSKSRHVTRSTIDDRSFVLFSLDWKSRDHTRTHTHTHIITRSRTTTNAFVVVPSRRRIIVPGKKQCSGDSLFVAPWRFGSAIWTKSEQKEFQL